MKLHAFERTPRLLRTRLAAMLVSVFGFGAAQAATDVQVWVSLIPHNQAVFDDLVDDFNSEQSEVRVEIKTFNTSREIEPALLERVRDKQKTPHLVQIDDNRNPEALAAQKHIAPLHTLLAKYPIKHAQWFVAPQNLSMRDARGRLLAFPYMIDVPVMFYNIRAFEKAGMSPAVPQRSWYGLQEQLVDLANKATRNCPAITDQSVSVNLENLAAVNNQFFTSADNGTKAQSAAFTFDTTFVRHLSLMIAWVRSELLVDPEPNVFAPDLFAANECSVLWSESSNIGRFIESDTLKFGLTGLPYYPQVTKVPGSPFLDGTGLWATSGHTDEEHKATVKFLAWLAEPDNAARWYQETGFLPLTKQAFEQTGEAYYKDHGIEPWRDLVAVYAKPPSETGRGFKIKNYPQIREMFHKKLDEALGGQYPAVTALTTAKSEASRIMQGK
ncbi:MAG: glycerol-3-phosphate ABC transporter substrate-binding protein [Alcaligenaceae bacterium]|nr:glycerol-3-phosphate ABC transporter substrate-binding protein [Alcaligenaceae bacterium]